MLLTILCHPVVCSQSEAHQIKHGHDDLLRHSIGKNIHIAVDNRYLYNLEANQDQPESMPALH